MNAYKVLAVLLLTAAPALAFAQYDGDESGKSAIEMYPYRYPSYRYPSISIPQNFGSIPENSRSVPSRDPELVGPRSIPGDSRSIPSR